MTLCCYILLLYLLVAGSKRASLIGEDNCKMVNALSVFIFLHFAVLFKDSNVTSLSMKFSFKP